MTTLSTTKQITNYIKAGYSGLYVVSHEDQRVQEDVLSAARAVKGFKFFTWSCTAGTMQIQDGEMKPVPDTHDPIDALMKFFSPEDKSMHNSVLLLNGFHLYLADANPIMLQTIKDGLMIGKATNRTIIILSCLLKLPPDLEKLITVIEYKLPDREQLLDIASKIAASADLKLNGHTDEILDAASGLTTHEAENAFALSVIEARDITAQVVSREKSSTVKKNGLLEIVENKIELDDIGGLENLKHDLHSKRNLFKKEAREYGLDTPRGILVVGQPGTGKSLTAQATKSIFGLPLVKLEAGRIFGGLVGQSEQNWRTAFSTVKAISPCILWVDEVDGLFSGGESSGKTDGGTTQRVIKAILQDMQFNGEGVFFVFTANDVDNLPDPLIDRLDVWSVDLPNHSERESIWSIHLAKRGRKPAKFDLPMLAGKSDGFSGRQIEQVLLRAMIASFNDKQRELTEKDIIKCLAEVIPTSTLMATQIERRRQRLQHRAQPASKAEQSLIGTGARKLVD